MAYEGNERGVESTGGRVVGGRYRLRERLGRGGMGVVWRATDDLLGREVAVKELITDSSRDTPWYRERTLREARAVAQVRHPNVIVVHDVVEDEGRPHIVMELVEGPTLAERIAAAGPLTPAETARIGLSLLAALRTAHDLGVLHRDLKPANVLLEHGTGRVVLTDFGIAQLPGAATITEAGSFVGSPEYTAPERMSGAAAGPAADLWSLGVLLCAALSGGETPFHRDSLSGVLHAVVLGEIRPPAAAGPLLPVVTGLLDRDPARRLDAAGAERLLLAFTLTGTTPHAPPGHAPARDAAHAPHASRGPHDPDEHAPPAPARRPAPGPPGALPDPAPLALPLPLPLPGVAQVAIPVPVKVEVPGPPPRRYRLALVAAALVAAIGGAAVAAGALLLDRNAGRPGQEVRTVTSTATATGGGPTSSRPAATPSEAASRR
ncbi:serine/threonine-protein kinase [Streptomyces sp. NPDC060194]|uniref:serine/threonine-protein kinase n=1 Tax=Streptomyces sp. NPDC060194 TaxID=3347069 RepID=UPI003664CE4C